jgi:hypothetical protein
MPEGIWYGATENTDQFTFSSSTFDDESITTSGNLPALPKCTVSPTNGNATIKVWIEDDSGATNVSIWDFTGTVTSGQDLVVDPVNYICTNNAVDAYSSLDYGYDADTNFNHQIAFLYFSGTGATINGALTGAGTAGTCDVAWWDRYIF